MIQSLFYLLVLPSALGGSTATVRDEAVIIDDYGPCGLTSLYIVCRIRGVPTTWQELQALVGPRAADETHSFDDLSGAAKSLGMHPVALQAWDSAALARLPMPAILQVYDPSAPEATDHLLVLLRVEADGVWLLDAPYSHYFLPEVNLKRWSRGNILVFADDEAAARALSAAGTNYVFTSLPWAIVAGLLR